MLSESLGLSPGDVCSLAGGGGKTSCLYSLAAEDPWGSTLLTTTTMMRDPREEVHPFSAILMAPRDKGVPEPGVSPLFVASGPVSGTEQNGKGIHKVKGFSPETIDSWAARGDWSLTVVEADGAAGRSLKMPREGEPLIPASATVVIGVIGLDLLGSPAGPERIHRFPLFREKTGIRAGEAVKTEHLCAVVNHPEGLFKGAPPQARKILLLNKADSLAAIPGITPEQVLREITGVCSSPETILLTVLSDFRHPAVLAGTKPRRNHVPF